jgi:hypothetical protein
MRSPLPTLDYSEEEVPLLLGSRARARHVAPHAPPARTTPMDLPLPSMLVASVALPPIDHETALSRVLRRVPTGRTTTGRTLRRQRLRGLVLRVLLVVALCAVATLFAAYWITPAVWTPEHPLALP